MPHDQAFARQARAADTLRWGGRTSLAWGPKSPAGGNANVNLQAALNAARGKLGSQLVNAHWRWPIQWKTLVCLVPQFAPDETGSVDVAVTWTIGSGDAQQSFQTNYTVGPPYLTVLDNTVDLPAADVQVTLAQGALTQTPGEGKTLSTASVDFLEVAIFVAPVTEAHALLHLAESLEALLGATREGGWMPPGFHPEPLGYDR